MSEFLARSANARRRRKNWVLVPVIPEYYSPIFPDIAESTISPDIPRCPLTGRLCTMEDSVRACVAELHGDGLFRIGSSVAGGLVHGVLVGVNVHDVVEHELGVLRPARALQDPRERRPTYFRGVPLWTEALKTSERPKSTGSEGSNRSSIPETALFMLTNRPRHTIQICAYEPAAQVRPVT